jgi:hypothetical protein
MCDKFSIFLFPFAFIRFYSLLGRLRRQWPGIHCRQQAVPWAQIRARLIDADERRIRPPADRRNGPFGRYGFYQSHLHIYLSYGKKRREDFFM